MTKQQKKAFLTAAVLTAIGMAIAYWQHWNLQDLLWAYGTSLFTINIVAVAYFIFLIFKAKKAFKNIMHAMTGAILLLISLCFLGFLGSLLYGSYPISPEDNPLIIIKQAFYDYYMMIPFVLWNLRKGFPLAASENPKKLSPLETMLSYIYTENIKTLVIALIAFVLMVNSLGNSFVGYAAIYYVLFFVPWQLEY